MQTSRLAFYAALGTTATVAHADTSGWDLIKEIQIEEIMTETTYRI